MSKKVKVPEELRELPVVNWPELSYKSDSESKFDLQESDISELIEILKIENRRLEENLCFLEKKEQIQRKSLKQSKCFIIIALFLGLTAISIPIISIFYEIPSVIISLSIVCVFFSGIWLFSNWDNILVENSADNVNYKIERCRFLLKEIKCILVEESDLRKEAIQ